MLSGLLTFLLIVDALVLVLLIIALQHGNEGGIGTAFGSGNSTGFFGATGGVSLIIRATWICGALFFLLSMALAWNKTHDHFGVGREIQGLLGAPSAPKAESGAGANPTTSPIAPGAAGSQAPPAAEGMGSAPAAPAAPATQVPPAAKPATAP